MASDLFFIKRGDLLPDLVLTLTDNGAAVDLTSATEVRILLTDRDTGTLVVSAVAASATNLGVVTYHWQIPDTATARTFKGEVQVTWPGSKPQTFDPEDYFTVKVVADLGP